MNHGLCTKGTEFAALCEGEIYLYTLYMYKGVFFRSNANGTLSAADDADKLFAYGELLLVPTPTELLRLSLQPDSGCWFDTDEGVVFRRVKEPHDDFDPEACQWFHSDGYEFWNGLEWEEQYYIE